MVLKKPYAFLIKYFKVLHLILAGLMIYLSVKINLITNLFDKLSDNISIFLEGISAKYVNGFMYLVIILIIGIAFVIWFLMKKKQKPTNYYLCLIVYYFILLVFLIVYASALSSLEEVSMTNNALRAYKDISFLLPIGQYYFIVIAILRGIGFNIKQFNFSKDIKELEISEEDSEEIEINLSSNIYRFKRNIRKYIRELKYYFFENKYWILIVLGLIVISVLIYFFVNYKFVNSNYSQGNSVIAGQYNVFVNNVFITDKDLYGNLVSKNKKYVIIDLRLRNMYYQSLELDTKKFVLDIQGDYYYPTSSKNSSFKDLGNPYDYKYLESNKDYNYLLIYEINNNIKTNKMKLKIYKSLDYDKNRAKFINIKLKSQTLKNEQEISQIKVSEEITINDSKFNITSFDVINKYEYNYELCVEKTCAIKTGVIIPDDILNKKLLRIDYELDIQKESLLNKFIKSGKNFFDTFATLAYTYNGNKNSIKINSKFNDNVSNIIFLEVNKEIENASEIELIVNTRQNKYIYKLK